MSEARGGEPVYALTDAEAELLGLRFTDPPASYDRIATTKKVRERTGWSLGDAYILVTTACRHGRPAVTYDEMRVERLRRLAQQFRGNAKELECLLDAWDRPDGTEVENLEELAVVLRFQSDRLFGVARDLRYERGEDDPQAEQAARRKGFEEQYSEHEGHHWGTGSADG